VDIPEVMRSVEYPVRMPRLWAETDTKVSHLWLKWDGIAVVTERRAV